MPPQGGRKHPHQDFLQIDTTNILFIVAGAFAGLEDIINQRVGARPVGFNVDDDCDVVDEDDLLSLATPEDLHKFGLIPEFIGRLPMITTVDPLDREALMSILTEPCNALTQQFEKLFELDGVQLEFTEEAIGAVADKALERGTGARGLRAILEETLMEVMYEVPSRQDVARVVVTADAVRGLARCKYSSRTRVARGRLSA